MANKKIALLYIGRRIHDDGKLCQIFLNGKKEHIFSGVKYVQIGYWYEAERKGHNISMKVKPTQVRDAKTMDRQIENWDALDCAAVEEHKRIRMAIRLAKNPERIGRIIEQLNPIVKGMKHSDLNHLLNYIFARLET